MDTWEEERYDLSGVYFGFSSTYSKVLIKLNIINYVFFINIDDILVNIFFSQQIFPRTSGGMAKYKDFFSSIHV